MSPQTPMNHDPSGPLGIIFQVKIRGSEKLSKFSKVTEEGRVEQK